MQVKLRQGAAVWREMDGETVALDVAASDYLGINAAGSALWPALVRGTSRDELGTILQQRFGLDEAAAAADVDAFLSALGDRGLLSLDP